MRRIAWILPAFMTACLVAAPACSTKQRVRTETTLARALISDEQSTQIGLSVASELKQQGVRFVDDPRVTGYVDGIAARILPLARRDRPGIDYTVAMIDDPEQVNAFATPGGFLYIYTGLLLAADNEAEVAGVLAHEAGHIAGRHVERAMVNAYGLQALLSVALGTNPSQVKEIAAGIAATGAMRAHGRSEETEADEFGARYAARAGYDPQAMITFFRKLAAGEGSSPGFLEFLRTHPTSQDRIDHLRRFIRDKRLSGTTLGADPHRQIKQHLSSR